MPGYVPVVLTWANIGGKPTTLSGFGLTDFGVNGVGTVSMMINNSTAAGPGSTAGGGGLAYADTTGNNTGVTGSGTWRCLGNGTTGAMSVWQRIA